MYLYITEKKQIYISEKYVKARFLRNEIEKI